MLTGRRIAIRSDGRRPRLPHVQPAECQNCTPRLQTCRSEHVTRVWHELHTLLTAYRNGYFPFPPENEYWRDQHEAKWGAALDQGVIPALGVRYPRFTMPWWSPGPRAVLTHDRARLGDSVRRRLRRTEWTTTVDAAIPTVVERCGPSRGAESWLSRELADAYLRLAQKGVLHSVEVWDEEENLIGGMFGVLVGAVMMGESGFRTRDNAVRVALLDALYRFTGSGGDFIDVP